VPLMSGSNSQANMGQLESQHAIQHIAIIMDGNGRWAQRRGLPRSAGHKSGVKSVRTIIEACEPLKIKHLTLFAFSSENWQRPEDEVGTLMDLFLNTLAKELESLHKNGVRLRFIGDKSAFSNKLQERMKNAEKITENNDTLHLSIAANYGGRWDMTQAARAIAKKVQDGILDMRHVTEESLDQHLSLADIPDPDLLIRTGGESRVSNFLLWQLAYAELYFSDQLWPDFDQNSLKESILWYTQRQRRFGKTSEQVDIKNA